MADDMEIRKKLNPKRHLVALVLTLAFFTIGILIGSLLTSERFNHLQDKALEQNLDFESLQTQYLYVSLMNQNKSCPVVSQTFESNVKNLEDTRRQLEKYIKETQINPRSYFLMKREYIIAQVRYWLLAKSTQQVCNRDIVSVIYFFSSPKSCADCGNQGLILTYLKKVFGDKLLIFSFDSEFEDEPFIPILKGVYNVTAYPTIIIGDERFEGLQEKDVLLKEICNNYKYKYDECKVY